MRGKLSFALMFGLLLVFVVYAVAFSAFVMVGYATTELSIMHIVIISSTKPFTEGEVVFAMILLFVFLLGSIMGFIIEKYYNIDISRK